MALGNMIQLAVADLDAAKQLKGEPDVADKRKKLSTDAKTALSRIRSQITAAAKVAACGPQATNCHVMGLPAKQLGDSWTHDGNERFVALLDIGQLVSVTVDPSKPHGKRQTLLNINDTSLRKIKDHFKPLID